VTLVVSDMQQILPDQNLAGSRTLCRVNESMFEDKLKAKGIFLKILFGHKRTEKLATYQTIGVLPYSDCPINSVHELNELSVNIPVVP